MFGSRIHEGPRRTRSAKITQGVRPTTNLFVFFVLRALRPLRVFVIQIPSQRPGFEEVRRLDHEYTKAHEAREARRTRSTKLAQEVPSATNPFVLFVLRALRLPS
jgi:hypothetical protein